MSRMKTLITLNILSFIFFFHFSIFSISNCLKVTDTKNQSMSSISINKDSKDINFKDKLSSNSTEYFNYLKNILSVNSLNTCKEENCEFCCLSINICGSKDQCENKEDLKQKLKIVFHLILFIVFLFICYKVYITEGRQEQKESEKIDDKTLNFLIKLFMNNKEHKIKFKE